MQTTSKYVEIGDNIGATVAAPGNGNFYDQDGNKITSSDNDKSIKILIKDGKYSIINQDVDFSIL